MIQVTIQEAKTNLSALIQQAINGEEIVIAQATQPMVKLVVVDEKRKIRRIGGASDVILHIAEDFDVPLDDFAEYMK